MDAIAGLVDASGTGQTATMSNPGDPSSASYLFRPGTPTFGVPLFAGKPVRREHGAPPATFDCRRCFANAGVATFFHVACCPGSLYYTALGSVAARAPAPSWDRKSFSPPPPRPVSPHLLPYVNGLRTFCCPLVDPFTCISQCLAR